MSFDIFCPNRPLPVIPQHKCPFNQTDTSLWFLYMQIYVKCIKPKEITHIMEYSDLFDLILLYNFSSWQFLVLT